MTMTFDLLTLESCHVRTHVC